MDPTHPRATAATGGPTPAAPDSVSSAAKWCQLSVQGEQQWRINPTTL